MATIQQPKTTGFLSLYAQCGYNDQVKLWQRCRDAFSGEDAIKARGAEYLYQTQRKAKNAAQWLAYLGRAKFPAYPHETVQKMLGTLSAGEPTIALPDELAYLEERVTPYRDGLEGMQRRINEHQLKFGRYGLLLEVAPDGRFYVNEYRAEKILRAHFVESNGESYADFVLLDESGYEFNIATKTDEWKEKLRILGIDANGFYYQAQVDTSEYSGFDLKYPREDMTVYPTVFEKPMNRIPFTWVNVSNLSGAHWQNPPMLNLVNLCLHIYNDDACHEQTLFMTSEPDRTVIGGDGKDFPIETGAGAVNFLAKDFEMKFTEFSGAGADAQLKNLETMHKQAQDMGVSLAGIESAQNQSGVALDIIRNSQVAALMVINETAGLAIQEQLRYAGKWLQYPDDKIAAEIIYEPSKQFARMKMSAQEIVSVITAKLNAGGKMPLTWEEIRRVFVESGWGAATDWDELQASLDAESVQSAQELA